VFFRVLQNVNNLVVSDVDPALRDLCVVREVVIIIYSSLGVGFLIGKYRGGV